MKFIICLAACLFSAASFGQEYYGPGPVYQLPGNLNPQPVEIGYRLPGHLDPRPVYVPQCYYSQYPIYHAIHKQISNMPYMPVQSFPIYSPTYPSQWYRTNTYVPSGPIGQIYEFQNNSWTPVQKRWMYVDNHDGRGFHYEYGAF